jgi:hypothetical protein
VMVRVADRQVRVDGLFLNLVQPGGIACHGGPP